jgi:hypothetical protein
MSYPYGLIHLLWLSISWVLMVVIFDAFGDTSLHRTYISLFMALWFPYDLAALGGG